jgi:hypothetical protein
MAPPQSITVIDPLSWPHSTVTRLALSELVTAGQLAVVTTRSGQYRTIA